MPKWLKFAALIVLLLTTTVLAATGIVDQGLGWCGLNYLSRSNDDYLDGAFDSALAGFLVLSGIKSGLAIVEDSSVGVGVNIQLGDIVQPVYDYVDIAWKAAMAGAAIITVMKLALQGLTLIDHWALTLLLACGAVWCLSKWLLPERVGLSSVLKNANRFTAALCVGLYLLLPLTVAGAAFISRHITAPLLKDAQSELELLGDELSPESLYHRFFPEGKGDDELASFNLKGKIEKLGQGAKDLAAWLKLKTGHIAALTLKLIAAYLFDCILFPLFFGLVLVTMIKKGVGCFFQIGPYSD